MIYIAVLILIASICISGIYTTEGGSQFTGFDDTDGERVQLRPLPKLPRQIGSCYEIKKGMDDFTFCYPALHVAGVSKCGTSAMYEFLVEQDGIEHAKPPEKEYCPRGSIFDYLRAYKNHHAEDAAIYVNGCIATSLVRRVHEVLKPQAAYILTVRNFADRLWASFNFWCSSRYDLECKGGRWTKDGMYRTPELFHEMLVARFNYSQSQGFVTTCHSIRGYYSGAIAGFATSGIAPPHVVAIEALSLPGREAHLLRLQAYINDRLGTNLTLDAAHLHRVNTGDHKGATTVGDAPTTAAHEEGQYKLSGYRHMLPESERLITDCWADCRNISALTHHDYNCTWAG